ncbi:MAG: ATP-binding domain-containing protein [Symploca sp. SIO3C6]|uniref:ATP-binding domain-containing protein n=1 Tax=Symploca sp. SIO1C4 TaxID=2607765 RepID=A0A6B3NCV3_9CYAN|nr:ATP-binding domain-containing protein [Symploca sp. SIO3C6]NER29420.1 ATP-binding domain-containing protein [Symploca sp. SIO1C4]NET07107.1 ATP-binding domain-containing protein [Symploca sp. SIO2B6]
MSVTDLDQGRKFITTEPIAESGAAGEQKVWDAAKNAFSERDCIGYWRYPIFSKLGDIRKEPDILIIDRELSIIVIEVKSITIDQIVAIDGHLWQFQNFYTTEASPYQQAERQLRALIAYCDREPPIWRKVTGRAIVALPLITQEQWQQRGFEQLPSCPPIIFQEQLSKVACLERIQQSAPVVPGENLDDQQWKLFKIVISGAPVLRKPPRTFISTEDKSRARIVAACSEHLHELDLQQEHIGKEIPPGFQRLRGIAGSGKTVLLCQKAAHMHLKHPDWDIALVFFSRTLYEMIIGLVDRWLRRFSHGDLEYDHKTNKKLRVLHAWGAKEQPGLYRTICELNGTRPKSAGHTKQRQPNRGLAELCKRLSEEIKIEPCFDAILIDEGQDLVVDDDLKYQDKQAIYWMAYQALRPVDWEQPQVKRLVWAYDEAQSLDSLKIPTAKELLGENLSGLLSQGTQYTGGIKKSEVMRRCYRTPGPILTAAHAIGMGLLRPEGMLTGITRKEYWETIGYEVKGKFIPGQKITLHRPSENSPNPVPELWRGPVLEFETYDSRQEEMSVLADKIMHNLVNDDLKPSREIIVIILGSTSEAMELENHLANFLIEQDINIYIPTALELNELKPQWPHINQNRFWMEGGVTISRVPRAKGNEADMVYVVGFDNIARNESDVSLRNQLFVALTRSRGWASLSGVGSYPMYEEMQRVIESGDTFTFTYKRPLKRDIGESD